MAKTEPVTSPPMPPALLSASWHRWAALLLFFVCVVLGGKTACWDSCGALQQLPVPIPCQQLFHLQRNWSVLLVLRCLMSQSASRALPSTGRARQNSAHLSSTISLGQGSLLRVFLMCCVRCFYLLVASTQHSV